MAHGLRVIPKKQNGVQGITMLNEVLFVVRYRSPSVDVYRASDFRELGEIRVQGMKLPFSLAACPQYNCLYVSDYQPRDYNRVGVAQRGCIHRVDMSSKAITNWPVDESPN